MWRIDEKVLGINYGIVKYNVLKCLESVQEMTDVINKAIVGYKVKEFISFEDQHAYFLLEVIK